MPTYQYRAVTSAGKKKKGFVEASSQSRAFAVLQGKGLMPLQLEQVKGGHKEKESTTSAISSSLSMSGKVRLGESFYYLGILLQSGTALAQSLDMLARMSSGKAGRTWIEIRDAVQSGESFSSSLAKYPKIFPEVYIGMVQVAESVGKLGEVLEKIASHEEERAEVSGRLMTAMVYPLVILLVGMGAVYFLLSEVLPKITGIFEAAKGELPTSTKIVVAVGDTLQSLGPMALIIPLAIIFALTTSYRTVPKFREKIDALFWRIPLVQKSTLARFSGILGFQLESGIPLVQGMESSSKAISSTFFKKRMAEAREEVATGRSLSSVLAEQKIYPEIYILTLTAGQKSGELGKFLQRLGAIFERDVDNFMKRVVSLAEPLLLLFIGMLIAFIVVAIMGPIFDLTTLVK